MLTVLSFEEPQSFRKTAYAMYASEVSHNKSLNRIAKNIERQEARKKEEALEQYRIKASEDAKRHQNLHLLQMLKETLN